MKQDSSDPHSLRASSVAAALPKPHSFSSQVAMNILNSGRFSMGSASAGMIKKLIGGCIPRSACSVPAETALPEV